jgi:hypothetical protein
VSDVDLAFTFKKLKNGDVVVSHRGQQATTLRKDKAEWFLEEMHDLPFEAQQQEMARLTGNYKRGNERTAQDHPRNR